MLRLNIVMIKRDDDSKFVPCAAFLSKHNAMDYIANKSAEEPTTAFENYIVNFEDIEEMKVWQLLANNRKCHPKEFYPELVFYEKKLAECAVKLLEYPKDTEIKEHTLKGPKFMDKYMEEHDISFYIHYQVLFTENGEIDTSDPKSNTVEEYYTDKIGIIIGEPIIENDDPSAVKVSIFYTLKNPIHKDELLEMAKKARIDYIHSKYDLDY